MKHAAVFDGLSGVGKETAARLAELGISTSADLLNHFPYRYEDLRFPTPSNLLGASEGEENAVGHVVSVRERRTRLAIIEATIADAAGTFTAKWFGRPYLIGALKAGMRVFVRGRVTRTFSGVAMNVSAHRILTEEEEYRGELVPIYPATKRLASRRIRQIVARNLPKLLPAAADPLPPALASSFDYSDIRASYRSVHAPVTLEEAARARERFVFTEFLTLALAAKLKRNRRETQHARALSVPPGLLAEFQGILPHSMTGAQRRVIVEIWNDMARESPMNRLLQGDVGSGKTLVAAAAIAMAARSGVQSALMAPTEILASQHAQKLTPLLLPLGITVEAVFGSQGAKARAQAVSRLGTGEGRLAVGTHALLTEGVDFAELGLVIIDEQHRFGVEQRASLRAKGVTPHTLHMTATPIPRTLAQSVYADLDISTIDELPPGRTPVETFALRRSRLARAHEFVRQNVAAGHQAYIVAPAIEESDAGLTSVRAEFERLQRTAFSELRLGLLHGRLTPKEKDAVMLRFVRGETDVLVATTVIEVGVDVPNASVMMVLDAQRYGLAQLHQLRGRVGRGAARSFCLLIAPDEAGEVERLDILTRTSDGFAISEEDLRLRGPGEFSGTAQSGLAGLKFGDLVADIEVYRRAKAAAEQIIAKDSGLSAAEHGGLRGLLESQSSARAMLLSS
ncbi:MAG: DNA helicase RecG [Candidatus Meridianibacter frigidus]|nr:MAG: DNA helicase RecG [Candidatus Eremiobacteraeota bacterium]